MILREIIGNQHQAFSYLASEPQVEMLSKDKIAPSKFNKIKTENSTIRSLTSSKTHENNKIYVVQFWTLPPPLILDIVGGVLFLFQMVVLAEQ